MLSTRQAETMVWIAQLGTFERAAAHLATTQSAISKRVQELEATLGVPLFDRSLRKARLTPKGEEILEICRRMLALQDEVAAVKAGNPSKVKRRLRLGVTELGAITWLPELVAELRRRDHDIIVEPEVDIARNLCDHLLEGRLDLIVCPDVLNDSRVRTTFLADVELAWMAQPGSMPQKARLSLPELAHHPLLLQGTRSGAGSFVTRWLTEQGMRFERVLTADSMMAVVAMTMAGLGISYLPAQCFDELRNTGKLMRITTVPAIPAISYVAMHLQDHPSSFVSDLPEVMRGLCDFTRHIYQVKSVS